jgi:hypothetical protein
MLPLFLGLTALSVDVSVVAIARSQLSTAADAGALAGAVALADQARLQGITDLTNEINAANSAATKFVQANQVLGQTLVVTNGDTVVGYIDPRQQPLPPNTPPDTSAANQSKFNAVQVTTARDSNHGSVVPGFFSKLMGFQGSSPSVTSTAIAQNFSIAGVTSNLNAPLLPIVLDLPTYNNMISRNPSVISDQYTWNPATTPPSVTNGPDGIYESVLYPVPSGSGGNWGTINVGVSNNSTSIISNQIQYGITPAQLATYPNSTIALDYTKTPPQIPFSGNPGISAGIESALNAIIGKPVTIPIYDPTFGTGGNGNNASYTVVKFAVVRIMAVNFQGSNKYVIIQPALVNDPTAIPHIPGPNEPLPSWTEGGVLEVYLAR